MKKVLRGVRSWVAIAILLVSISSLVVLPKFAQAAGETINGGAAVSGAPSTQISISDLSISTAGNPTIPVKLLVTSGTLSMTTTTGLTFNGSSTGSTLYFSGTLSDINTALATLRYTRASTGSDTLEMSLVDFGEVFFPDNNHLYEYVSATLDWNGAQTAASGRTKYGATGYLATVGSSAENSFVAARLSNAGWMGASDSAAEGVWRWVTGPETNTQFWSGASGGSTVGGQYANWGAGEPNDAGGEDCAQYLTGGSGQWNDLPCSGTTLPGYVVEYGASGALPSVASKNVSVTVTNTAISGTAYASNGSTNLGSGKHVNILKNGVTVGTPTTNASGQYSLVGVSLANDDVITVFLDGDTEKGATVLRSNGSSATNLDIWQNTLITKSASVSALSIANLDTANNGDSDITYIYDDSGTDLILNNGANYYQPSSNAVTIPGGSMSGTVRIDGTLTVSTDPLYIYGSSVTVGGTITGGGSLYYNGSGTQTLTQTGTISLDLINWKANGTLRFLSNITISGSRWFTIYDNVGTTDCNNYALTTANFDLNEAGTYSCSAGNVTIGTEMVIRTAGAMFNVGSGTVDINGVLNINNGTFTASSGSTTIAGDINIDATGIFSAPSGTVTLDGAGDQAINGDVTFNNLSITDSSNNSTNKQINFDNGDDITITGTLTTDGLDTNDRVRLNATSGSWNLVFSGASSAYIGDFVEVNNSTVTSVSGPTVTVPLNPASSYNGGNNSGWFGITVAGTTHGGEPATSAVFTVSTNGTNITGAAIPVSISYSGTATSGSDFTPATASLANGASAATLTVPVLDDTIVEDTETLVTTLTGATGYTVISPSSASRNITSNESGAISLSAASGVLAEGDSRAISVTLGSQPGSDVLLDVSSSSTGDVSLDKSTLTFTSSNWNVAQIVTATAVRDYLIASGRSSIITVVANSSAPVIWQAVSAQTLAITLSDIDVAGVEILPSNAGIEEGKSTTGSITLGTISSGGSTVITATPGAGIDLGNGSGKPKDYVINSGSRTTTEAFVIKAVDDAVVNSNRSAQISFAVASSADSNYHGFAINSKVTVTIINDDKAVAVEDESTAETTQVDLAGSSILLNDFDEYTEDSGKPLSLGAAQVVFFNVIKESPKGQEEKEKHSVTVNAVADTYVDVTIASTPQYARLYIGDVKQYDVDKDGRNDIEITLKGIKNGLADITFRQLAAATVKTEAAVKKIGWSWLLWLIAALVGALILYVYMRRHRINQQK